MDSGPIDRLPPQNMEAEEAVLGALLIDPDAMLRIKHTLQPEHFYREKHGWIYSAAQALHERHEPIDFLTLCDELETRKQLHDIGGGAFLAKVLNVVPTSIHIEYYAAIVVRTYNHRRLIDMGTKIVTLGYQDGDDIEAYTQMLQVVQDTPLSGKKTESRGGKNLGAEMLSDLAQAQTEKDNRKHDDYEPEWPWLAMRKMARWRVGQPVVLIAEGGSGKTSFCTAVGTHNAINGGRVFYAATEDEPPVLRKRIMAGISGVPYRQIETATYDLDDIRDSLVKTTACGVKMDVPSRVLRSVRSTEAWRGEFYILPVTGLTMPEIIYSLSRLEQDVGHPDAVILDWFLDHKQRHSDNIVVGLMSDILELKNYSAEHKTRLLVATQTGKGGSGKRNLTSFDAYYTSSWNHYAKLAITIQRERELVNGEAIGPFKPEVNVFISKANLDLTGSFKLMMRGETLSIFEPETYIAGSVYDD